MKAASLLFALVLAGCSSNGLSRLESTLESKRSDAGTCAHVDGGAHVACDDDPDGSAARVMDCHWEWADDPCPDAGATR